MVVFKSLSPQIEIPEVDLHTFLFKTPDFPRSKVALVDSITREEITYGELSDRINYLACGFHALGLKEHEVIGIYSPNHIEYLIVAFAALRLGAKVTTANPTYTPDELNFQLNDAGARFLITIPELLENSRKAVHGSKVEKLFVFGPIGSHDAAPIRSLEIFGNPPVVEINDPKERTAFLCYSSGTTGKPKGVETTHYNVVANVLQVFASDGSTFRPTDVWCAVLPLYHCYSLIMVAMLGFYARVKIVIQSKFDLEQYLRIIQDLKVTMAHIVPPIIIGLAKHPIVDKFDLSSLRYIFSGAAPLGKEVEVEVARRLKCIVKQGYGMTELSPTSHVNPNDPAKIVSGSVGLLVSNMEAKIVNPDTGKELGVDEEGELWLRGPNVMKGYLNRPDATAETIDKDKFLHTGDIAKVDKNGYFYITDRLKELIKVKGLQVAPAELEGVLLSHPAIADVAVIGVPEDRAGEAPKAFVVLKPGIEKSAKTVQEIHSFLDGKVAPHKKLKGGIEFVDTIPKSAAGKILRRLIREQEKKKASKL